MIKYCHVTNIFKYGQILIYLWSATSFASCACANTSPCAPFNIPYTPVWLGGVSHIACTCITMNLIFENTFRTSPLWTYRIPYDVTHCVFYNRNPLCVGHGIHSQKILRILNVRIITNNLAIDIITVCGYFGYKYDLFGGCFFNWNWFWFWKKK